jgi:hypothetical protein
VNGFRASATPAGNVARITIPIRYSRCGAGRWCAEGIYLNLHPEPLGGSAAPRRQIVPRSRIFREHLERLAAEIAG